MLPERPRCLTVPSLRRILEDALDRRREIKYRAIDFLPLICTVCMMWGCASGGRARSPVIAEANGIQITKESFESFLSLKIGDLSSAEAPESVRSQMLDEYIKRRLVLEEATRAGLSVTESELDQAASDGSQFRPGGSAGIARAEYANDILIAKYYHQVVTAELKLSTDEVQRYLNENSARLIDRPTFDVREIRVESSKQAEQLRKQILEKKLEFTDAARLHSQAPSAEQGGFARYSEGQLPELLESALRRLRPGDISPVVQSSFGFHIFKLEGRVQPAVGRERRSTINETESKLIEELIGRKNQEAVDREVERIISSATIVIRDSDLGFTYAGRLRHNQ